jgi:activating signal cointegrator 1
MKILTLTQPWASLVALGAKHIETRSWSTNYRGPIAIHAGASLGPVGGRDGLLALCSDEPFLSVLEKAGLTGADLFAAGPRGAIVAVADLVECERITPLRVQQGGWLFADGRRWELSDQERAFGDYGPGRFAWLLANVRPLRSSLPYRGAQGLRPVTPEVAALIGAQL